MYQIEVRLSKIGERGVFALKDFKKSEIIECCPVIKLKPSEREYLEETILDYYMYPWKNLKDAAIALGLGSIYNHSDKPNAKWVCDYKKNQMIYKALQNIKKGEEITVDYNGPYEPDDMDWLHHGQKAYKRSQLRK